MNSVREKTSASNEPICKEEKAEFLIAQIAQITIDCNQLFPLDFYTKEKGRYSQRHSISSIVDVTNTNRKMCSDL
jgi:hypothetical protein